MNMIRNKVEDAIWGTPKFHGFSHAGSPIPGEWIVPSRMLSTDRPATAAEIHAALDTVSDEEIARAERILEYRRLYPSNPFLTKEQVQALCLKYDLVMAPDFMFAGDIPEKNRAERAAFRLQARHEECRIEDEEFMLLSMRSEEIGNLDGIVHGPKMPLPNNLQAPWLMVVNHAFALYCPEGYIGLYQWLASHLGQHYYPIHGRNIPAIPMLRTSKGFVRMSSQIIRPLSLDVRHEETFSHFGMRGWVQGFDEKPTCHFRFDMPMVHKRRASYTADISQMVVCPVSMLHQEMQIDMEGGWEATFAWRPQNMRGRGADPIILQPVEHGYLVVTKWDAEASLPEVAGQTN